LERLEAVPVVGTSLNEAEVVIGPGYELPFSEWKIYWGMTRLGPAIVSTRRGFQRTQRQLPPPGVIGWIPGDELFRLHDTYGVRPDFVEDVVKPYGLAIDRAGYEAEMQRQRERARTSWKGGEKKVASPTYQKLAERQQTAFDGYTQTASPNSRIVALVQKGEAVEEATPGEEVEVVLDHTPL
jgi:alanyl-tRNA synthetase